MTKTHNKQKGALETFTITSFNDVQFSVTKEDVTLEESKDYVYGQQHVTLNTCSILALTPMK
jgi:hypothetical protein